MCTRGIFQLKHIKLIFCDWGGSSKGTRDFLDSDILKEFIKKNPQISFDFILKRGSHPFIDSTYINGYIKSQSLRNMDRKEILNEFERVRTSFGRKHIPHSGKKVYGILKSIQGGWKPNMWNNYPKHELERVTIIPQLDLEAEMKENIKFSKPLAESQKDYYNAVFKERKTMDDV